MEDFLFWVLFIKELYISIWSRCFLNSEIFTKPLLTFILFSYLYHWQRGAKFKNSKLFFHFKPTHRKSRILKKFCWLPNNLCVGGDLEAESIQLRTSPRTSYSLSPEDQSYKELVTLNSRLPDQSYRALVTLNTRWVETCHSTPSPEDQSYRALVTLNTRWV